MKINNLYLYIVIILTLGGCGTPVNTSVNRIFVVQEIKLAGGYSLFWFRDERQVTHEGLSYFQFAKDKCELSIEKANAYCDKPSQVYDIKGDTALILTHTDIIPITLNNQFSIKQVGYSSELYSISKRPEKSQQFFLDSLCKE